jgi:arylsulfatase A-like enzyme
VKGVSHLWLAAWLGVACIATAGERAIATTLEAPSLVFILLDTTRADRFGAWGHRTDVTPTLDRLASRGIRFVRHYANSHATRPSMPQLLSGRYYHANVLGPFQTDAHPREMSFTRRDPTAILLPQLLGAAGYATLGVSAHTWVAPDSDFGRSFDHLELLPFTVAEGHGDAVALVDRALALWHTRERRRPAFLYLHFMDPHIPRPLPEGAPMHPVPGYDWRARFRPNGEPAFDRARRGWSRFDASDFTDDDRAHYAATYDTRLHHADAEIGRLLADLERDDPGLRRTVVVVTADHGEELGEDGRIEHSSSLGDGVQRVPWIVAGGAIEPGRSCNGLTEHVDLLPTIAGTLGIPLPEGIAVDGTSWLDAGRLRTPCGNRAIFHAWEDYRAVRTKHYLLVERPRNSPEGRCEGAERLYRVDGVRRRSVDATGSQRRAARLRRMLEGRLGSLERAYRTARYEAPRTSFLVRSDFWELAPDAPARCVRVDEDTPRAALREEGWFWTGRGLALTNTPGGAPVVRIAAPPGTYAVEAATTPIPRPPWFSGIRRWRRRAFGKDTPSDVVPLGPHDASSGTVRVTLPDTLTGHHVLGLRLIPPGASDARVPAVDPKQQDRLRALGYVQ